jgi:hypothetical protein
VKTSARGESDLREALNFYGRVLISGCMRSRALPLSFETISIRLWPRVFTRYTLRIKKTSHPKMYVCAMQQFPEEVFKSAV